jgi:hypothetical protein
MRRILLTALAVVLLAGCIVVPGRRGGLEFVPPLPPLVVLESEPYYQQGEYHYYYHGDRWSYSRSRNGPWTELPRDRYPKEVRFKGRGQDQGREDGREHDQRR